VLELPPEALMEVTLRVSVEIGRASMPVAEAVAQPSGTIVDLDRAPDEPVELLVNGRPFGRGSLVVVDGEWALRIDVVEGIEEAAPTAVQAP
jgi:flagellar motor switch protein FliN/FliY